MTLLTCVDKRKHSVRTFNVILGIRVWGFVVVNHLDHLEKVIFAESLKAVGQFIHIDLLTVLAWLEG